MRSSKSGGQRRDKVETAVRITHPASGAVGFSQDQRSREQNQRVAFRRLLRTRNWTVWFSKEKAIQMGTALRAEEWVEEMMNDKYLKIEVKEDGKWV
jgi:protein subunit release factor B